MINKKLVLKNTSKALALFGIFLISTVSAFAVAPKIGSVTAPAGDITTAAAKNLTVNFDQSGITNNALTLNVNSGGTCTLGTVGNKTPQGTEVFIVFDSIRSDGLEAVQNVGISEVRFFSAAGTEIATITGGFSNAAGTSVTNVLAGLHDDDLGPQVAGGLVGDQYLLFNVNAAPADIHSMQIIQATAPGPGSIQGSTAATVASFTDFDIYFGDSSNYTYTKSERKDTNTMGATHTFAFKQSTAPCNYTTPANYAAGGRSVASMAVTGIASGSAANGNTPAESLTVSSAVTVSPNIAVSGFEPVITVTSPNTDPAVEKIFSATDDINPPATSNWAYQLIAGTATCDATAFSGGAPIPYTEGDDIPLNTEDRNGQKVCFSSTGGGATSYKASNVIGGIDRTSPVISISEPSADTVVSDSFTITVTEINPNASTFKYSYVEDAATCNASITTAPALAFTSGTAISENTEANNGKYICAVATDVPGNTTYKSSANVININVAPTDINLSNNTVIENKAEELVGTFSAVDGSTNNTYTYSFIAGTGDTNNSDFTISGNEIKTLNSTDFETKDTYSVRVNVNDGLSDIEKVFEIKIIDGLDSRSIRTSSSSSSTKKVCKDDRASNYEKDGLHRQYLCEYGNNIVLEVMTDNTENTTETVVSENTENTQKIVNITSDQINVDKVRQELVIQLQDLISEILKKIISRLTSELAS